MLVICGNNSNNGGALLRFVVLMSAISRPQDGACEGVFFRNAFFVDFGFEEKLEQVKKGFLFGMEQAVGADFLEAFGHCMLQEAAKEFHRRTFVQFAVSINSSKKMNFI